LGIMEDAIGGLVVLILVIGPFYLYLAGLL